METVLDRRLRTLREQQLQLEHRLPGAHTLSREERATFYSQWYYSAVRLAASLPEMTGAESIASRLEIPLALVEDALKFLVGAGLLTREEGRYRLAAKRTHLGAGSPLAAAHHRNWRVQTMPRYETMSSRDFAFTSPVSISRADFARVRELLVQTVGDVAKIVEPSACESLGILNIDWIEL